MNFLNSTNREQITVSARCMPDNVKTSITSFLSEWRKLKKNDEIESPSHSSGTEDIKRSTSPSLFSDSSSSPSDTTWHTYEVPRRKKTRHNESIAVESAYKPEKFRRTLSLENIAPCTSNKAKDSNMFRIDENDQLSNRRWKPYTRQKANMDRHHRMLSKSSADVVTIGSSDDEDEQEPKMPTEALFYYPKGAGGIRIDKEDVKLLEPNNLLNDALINFYLKYLQNEILDDFQRYQSHIFDTYFMEKLIKVTNDGKNPEKLEQMKGWWKNVQLSDKDFIVVPINLDDHWFVAVLCFMGKQHKIDQLAPNIVERPCILVFDSSAWRETQAKIIKPLGDLALYIAQQKTSEPVRRSKLKISFLDVPTQPNATDCGLYLLLFVEKFFEDPIVDYRFPLKKDLHNWFTRRDVANKRQEMKSLIKRLSK